MHPPALAKSPDQLFLEQLPAIDRIAGALARSRGLVGMDAEDFIAQVRAKFVESDYAALRQHRGESSLATYLTVVIARQLQDHLVARDGRWRPSAAAVRLGPVAIYLERLLTRQRLGVNEAIERVLTEGAHGCDERTLRGYVRALPAREPMRPQLVDESDAQSTAGTFSADGDLLTSENDDARVRAMAQLQGAMQQLAPEDRLMVAMRFMDGRSVADIARALGAEQKPLYRRLESAIKTLRRSLEAMGLDAAVTRDVLQGDVR